MLIFFCFCFFFLTTNFLTLQVAYLILFYASKIYSLPVHVASLVLSKFSKIRTPATPCRVFYFMFQQSIPCYFTLLFFFLCACTRRFFQFIVFLKNNFHTYPCQFMRLTCFNSNLFYRSKQIPYLCRFMSLILFHFIFPK